MAKVRRVVRKVPPSEAHYFDEQLWPIFIALVVLGGFLMGVSLAYQPLAGTIWYRTAWPSLIGIPLVVAAAIVLLARIENRHFRRSVQLSLVLCAILHVAMVVQMIETQLFSGIFEKPRRELVIGQRRPQKIVPEYHPTQLVPEEDRPRQDFEKPVETESPQPTPEPERIVRQPSADEQSPREPQPVPVPEQQPTTEPNVVARRVPNEAAPRLAEQTSRLSRQPVASKSRQSQPVEMPAAARETAETPQARPTEAKVERRQAEAVAASRPRAEATPQSTAGAPTANLPNERARAQSAPPAGQSAKSSPSRRVASAPQPAASAVAQQPAAASASTANAAAQPARVALSRAEAGIAGNRKSANLDSGPGGGSGPAVAASSAARRAEATQHGQPGDALSPSSPVRIARSRAGAEIPTSSVKAEQVEIATAAGTERLAEVTASSGAALTRAAADARRDSTTAAKGVGEIDFGPTQIVTEPGGGRAAGGGQPELALQVAPTSAARRSTVGAPRVAADVTAVTDAPQAGSQVAEVAPQAEPTATVTTRVASDGPISGAAPSDNRRSGPATDPTSRTAVASSLTTRTIVAEDTPSPGDLGGLSGDQMFASSMSRATAAIATGGETTVLDIPEVGPRSAVAQAESDHLASGIAQTRLTRGNSEALAVDIAAPLGPGGLGNDFTPEVGVNSRQARADSMNVEVRAARFLRSQVGGLPAVSTAAVLPTEAYSGRSARVRGEAPAGGHGSPSPETEEAIERGLAFLARYQRPDGSWSLQGFPEGAGLASDSAATALALLAFQGAGYHHREFQYREVVRGGIGWLLKSQKENGDLFVPLDDASNKSVWLYSHSLAAIAICEAYGMTQDPALREPAQKAIDFIAASQSTERGGWRYAPGVGTDTSVTGWMMMALKSGELAGLDVAPATYRRIGRWLDEAQQSKSEPHLYRYNPYAPDTAEQRHGRTVSKTMTAVGLLMRLYTGWRRDDANMQRGAAYLLERPPAIGTVRDPQRDTYYWYYATQVMAHVGGQAWEAWMGRLHPLLVNSQIRQGPYGGSWDPRAPIADRWGSHAGRLYVTTMNLLSLEVQYRKLPLYESVASGGQVSR